MLTDRDDVVAFERGGVLVVTNTSPRPVRIDAALLRDRRPVIASHPVMDGELPADCTAWYG